MEDDYYTVGEAAKILKLTPGRVRQMLRGGELEGKPPEGDQRGWRIPMRAVHDRERPDRIERPPEPPESPERLSELEVEVRELRYQLGLSRGRLELTEKAESTLREALERERERATQVELERVEAQREIEALRSDLEAARQEAARPWWRKLFR
jgi:excisionase family DNA binding protein